MPRSDEYRQLGIGDCGHVVCTWPQLTTLDGHNPRVFCDDCTREVYGLDSGTQFITVRLVQDTMKPKPPRKRAPKKTKPKSPFQTLLEQEGLF